MARLVALAAVALLALPAVAHGATVRVTTEQGARGDLYDLVRYEAAPGEANRVRVRWTVADGWVFEESRAPLSAGPGCAARGEAVTCRPSPRGAADIDLGDGDDALTVESPAENVLSVTARGRAGDDAMEDLGSAARVPTRTFFGGDGRDALTTSRSGAMLAGDAGDDRLDGGSGGDRIDGGPGADVLNGSGGDDILIPGSDSDADVIDGGLDEDTADYVDYFRSVELDLAVDRGGRGDLLRGIEAAQGTYAPDVLAGDNSFNRLSGLGGNDTLLGRGAPDRLEAGAGNDRLEGGAGDDELLGDEGNDSLSGGSGNDVLDPGGSRSDRATCGTGSDLLVLHGGRRTEVPDDCELVRVGPLGAMRAAPNLRTDAATWSVLCTKAAHPAHGCKLWMAVLAGGAELGRAQVRMAPRERRRVRVPLGPAADRLAARGGRIEVEVRASGTAARYTVVLPR